MKIQYLHASKFGNGAAVAAEFQKQMAAQGVVVEIHHIRQARPAEPEPADRKTGRVPTEEELARWQRVRPIMNEILQGKGLVKVAEDKIYVTGLRGPLEQGWDKKVEAFVMRVSAESEAPTSRAA